MAESFPCYFQTIILKVLYKSHPGFMFAHIIEGGAVYAYIFTDTFKRQSKIIITSNIIEGIVNGFFCNDTVIPESQK